MSCSTVSSIVFGIDVPARKITATWLYEFDSQRGFKIVLQRRDIASQIITREWETEVGPSARSYERNKLHMGTGQEFRIIITTLCEGCTEAIQSFSDWTAVP